MINDNSLTERQSKFCTYYVELANGKQAAIKAGYSERTASSIGSENLNKTKIKDAIDEYQEVERKAMQRRLSGAATQMFDELIKVYFAKETPPQVKANIFKDILDRAGYKPVDEIDLQNKSDIVIEWVDADD